MTQPYDFAEAVARSRQASEAQHGAERWHAEKCREAAAAEHEYRKALADTMVRMRAAGEPATVVRDLARGDVRVAELAYQRDLSAGLRDAAAQAAWRHTADRKDLQEFLDWSKRAAFLDTVAVDSKFSRDLRGARV